MGMLLHRTLMEIAEKSKSSQVKEPVKAEKPVEKEVPKSTGRGKSKATEKK